MFAALPSVLCVRELAKPRAPRRLSDATVISHHPSRRRLYPRTPCRFIRPGRSRPIAHLKRPWSGLRLQTPARHPQGTYGLSLIYNLVRVVMLSVEATGGGLERISFIDRLRCSAGIPGETLPPLVVNRSFARVVKVEPRASTPTQTLSAVQQRVEARRQNTP